MYVCMYDSHIFATVDITVFILLLYMSSILFSDGVSVVLTELLLQSPDDAIRFFGDQATVARLRWPSVGSSENL